MKLTIYAFMVVFLLHEFAHAVEKLPKDVQAIIERKKGCGHWAGESPYNEDRKKEINAALATLKCDAYEKDLKTINKKYHNMKEILKAVKSASEDG